MPTVCKHTSWMAVKDGGAISTKQGNFRSFGSCLLPGIKKRQTKQKNNNNNVNFTPENVISSVKKIIINIIL